MRLPSFILSFLLFPVLLMAQEERKTVHLDDVQVVANRRLKDVGVEMTKLDTVILHDNISLSMADILSKNSTVFVKSYGRATESLVEFRGTSPSHTQVTWNGMRINSPMLGTLDFSTIPAYFIDEANLYHGASSINLIGGGLGGAIEMKNKPVEEKGWGAQFVQGIGSFDTYDDFLRLTYSNDRLSSSTRIVYSTADNDYRYTNYDKKTDVYDADGNWLRSYHPEERNKSGYFDDFHVLQDLFYDAGNGNQLGLSLWYTHSKRGLPFLSVDYKDDSDFKNEQRLNTLRGVLSWEQRKEQTTLSVRGGYSYSDVGYEYFTTRQEVATSITNSQSYSNTAFLQANLDWMLSPQLMLMGGADFYYTHVNSHDRSPFHIGKNFDKGRPEYHANLQARWRPLPIFSLAGVIRQEVYRDDFVAPIPALFADLILYQPWNLVLKASVARNYRYPSMDDLYFQPGGNPDLSPEKGFTYDAGLEMGVKKKRWTLRANATLFDSHISDWILWTPNTKGFWEPSNVKKVHNYGLEAMLDGSVLLAKDWKLSLLANFAWTPSKNVGEDINDNDASYGKQLCYVPKVSANVNARLQWRSWTLAYQWNHYSERYTTTSNEVNYITGRLRPYYMTDLSLEKTFRIRAIDCAVKGVVNNLYSTEYVTVLSRPMPRRNYEIYLTIKL
ncbi:MAG: TonB-dependent receptor [Bacteroidaceae bacterium]|nr:TonB-dependent receptor [Bacteroidaceae bacterium]